MIQKPYGKPGCGKNKAASKVEEQRRRKVEKRPRYTR